MKLKNSNTLDASPSTINQYSVSFVKSNKGKPLLLLNQYMFKCNKTTDSKRYWICTQDGCDVSVRTKLNNEFLSISGDHDHVIDPDVLQRKLLKQKMKDRIITETTSITTIYDEEISKANLFEAGAAQFPTVIEYRTYLIQENKNYFIFISFPSVIRFKYEQSSTKNNTCDPNVMRFRHPAFLSRNYLTQTFFVDGFFLKAWKGTCDRFFN